MPSDRFEPAVRDRYSYLRPLCTWGVDRALDPSHRRMDYERLAAGEAVFTHVEILRREGDPARRLIPVGGSAGFDTQDWYHPPFVGGRLWRQYERASETRPPIAGLALDRPRIMGIVNVTPDSFSDGGWHATAAAAIAHGVRLVDEGAEILDVGAESTRPGSDAVAVEEELARLLPVIEGLRARTAVPISVDTRKAEVMRRAAAAGAAILNDVSALTYDPASMDAAAASGLPVVLMHALGDPKTMQDDPRYDDVLLDVYDYLEARIAACEAAGIARERLVVDPGIGFGKTVEHNLALMAGLSIFHGLGVPVLLGASRKRFIGAITGQTVAAERVAGSVGAALAAAGQGAQILRVHDVAATRQALDVWLASVTGAVGSRQSAATPI